MQILLDISGVLKYADFGLSKVEEENLAELFMKFAEAGDQWNVQTPEEMMKQINILGKRESYIFFFHIFSSLQHFLLLFLLIDG